MVFSARLNALRRGGLVEGSSGKKLWEGRRGGRCAQHHAQCSGGNPEVTPRCFQENQGSRATVNVCVTTSTTGSSRQHVSGVCLCSLELHENLVNNVHLYTQLQNKKHKEPSVYKDSATHFLLIIKCTLRFPASHTKSFPQLNRQVLDGSLRRFEDWNLQVHTELHHL